MSFAAGVFDASVQYSFAAYATNGGGEGPAANTYIYPKSVNGDRSSASMHVPLSAPFHKCVLAKKYRSSSPGLYHMYLVDARQKCQHLIKGDWLDTRQLPGCTQAVRAA